MGQQKRKTSSAEEATENPHKAPRLDAADAADTLPELGHPPSTEGVEATTGDSESHLDSDDAGSAAASRRLWSPGDSSQSETKGTSIVAMTRPQQMRWVRANFRGEPPSPRCGHTAVAIGHRKVVIFGGFDNERYLNDILVYDIKDRMWDTPECTGRASDGQAIPCQRAFHVAVTVGNTMFIYGGRSEDERLGDLWTLDTAIWKWSKLYSFGDIPCPREFSAAAVIGDKKIVMYGGWAEKSLADLYLLDTRSLIWKKIIVAGLVPPPPRCAHAATVFDSRLVIFGGKDKSGSGDVWALNGISKEDDGEPTWTQLDLPALAMHARCAHTVTCSEHHLLLFGGFRTKDLHNECVIFHRGKPQGTQWTYLQISDEPPPPRSHHSMTCIGSRFLLFGGFDGRTMFNDLWCLVNEGDPNLHLDTNDYAKLSALKELLGADMDSISVAGSCTIRIEAYIGGNDSCTTCILYLHRDGNYKACRPKGQVREFHVRLSHLHLKQMVYDYLSSAEGKNAKLSEKLAICLLMAKRYGIVSEEDWAAGCPPEAVRYKIKAFRELCPVEKKEIPSLLNKGEAILSSFKVTSEYLDLLPHDIYRYREEDGRNGVTNLHQGHCVVLTSTGYEFKETDDDSEQSAQVEPPETYFEYMNSYSSGWGKDGTGCVYEDSLRKTYRIKIVDMCDQSRGQVNPLTETRSVWREN